LHVKDDAVLVAEALTHGPEAFGPIVDRYKAAVFGVALARVQNFHDAEDLTQEAFLEAFERLGSLREPDRLGAWLRSITIHRCINFLRRRTRAGEVEGGGELAQAAATPQDDPARRDLRDRVMAAIGRLSRVQRETVTLFYIDGYSVLEIAAMQEAPEGTIKRRLHEARHRLKEEMLEMVGDTLKESAPKEDFADRVFHLLCRYPAGPAMSWSDAVAELQRIGTRGIEGFIQAFRMPHARTRAWTVSMLGWAKPDKTETVIDLLKQGLQDSNNRVRRFAVESLLGLNVPDDRKRREFLPLIWPLFFDASRHVRRWVVHPWLMERWAAEIPLDLLCRALGQEQDPVVRTRLYHLLYKAVEAEVSGRGEAIKSTN
jgi:RNA polymerase sigma-70 factor (ECF subfamily)